MIKGPKAILSSAIANALEENFIVDASTIESNLLSDARIVLRNVQLKEQTSTIPINSAGKSTRITVTGCVDEVSFTWSWSVGDVVWVTDAVLTIDGARFQAKLEHAERTNEVVDSIKETGEDEIKIDDRREAFVNPSTIDSTSARQIKEQKGGLSGFVERQVKMIFDMLTLKLINFEIRIVLPHKLQDKPTNDCENVCMSSSNACNRVLVLGGEKIEILSFGRDEKTQDDVDNDTPRKLKQRINLNSLACGINMEGKEDGKVIISYPLLEPFSYSANTLRVGERFGGFLTGLEVIGLGETTDSSPELASLVGSGFVVHVSHTQIESLMQLSVMILAPPNESIEEDKPVETSLLSKESSSTESNENILDNFSSFTLPLASARLVLFDEMKFSVSGIVVTYKADGTVCSAEVSNMEFESDTKGRASVSQVVMSMRPSMQMTIGKIENLFIPNTVLLSTPIEDCQMIYEGNTLIMRLDTIDIVTFSKQEDDMPSTGPTVTAPYLPCNINLDVRKGIQIKKSDDGALTKIGRCHVYALKELNSSRIAIQFESFRNYLVSLTTVSFCGSIPFDQVDTINDLIFTADDIKIMSGHSTDEWETAFRPRVQNKQQRKAKQVKESTKKSSKQTKPSIIKLPFVNIADLKLVIGLDSGNDIGRVKDTTLVVKSFVGKADTTHNDLISYYIKACMSRIPDFISNAEVLGLNVVDSTTGKMIMFERK